MKLASARATATSIRFKKSSMNEPNQEFQSDFCVKGSGLCCMHSKTGFLTISSLKPFLKPFQELEPQLHPILHGALLRSWKEIL